MLGETHIRYSCHILRGSWQIGSFPESTGIWMKSKTGKNRIKENKICSWRRNLELEVPWECQSLGVLRHLISGLGLSLICRAGASARNQDDSRKIGKRYSQRASQWSLALQNILKVNTCLSKSMENTELQQNRGRVIYCQICQNV